MSFWKEKGHHIIQSAGIAIGLYLVFKYLLPLAGPLCFSVLSCLLLRPLAKNISHRSSLSESTWGIILFLFLAGLIMAGVIHLCSMVWQRGLMIVQDPERFLLLLEQGLGNCCHCLENRFHLQDGCLLRGSYRLLERLKEMLLKSNLTELFGGSFWVMKTVGKIGLFLLVFLVGGIFFFRDVDQMIGAFGPNVETYLNQLGSGIRIYLSAQLKLMGVTFLICLMGFWVSGFQAVFLWAGVTAFLDMLPFLGTGIILLPSAIYQLCVSGFRPALCLGITYLVCIVLRQLLEPRLIAGGFGIPPFFMLAGLYMGVRVFGLGGFILGPMYVLLLYALTRVFP